MKTSHHEDRRPAPRMAPVLFAAMSIWMWTHSSHAQSSVSFFPTPTQSAPCLDGDVSGDGTISAYDAALIRAHLLGMNEPGTQRPDGWCPDFDSTVVDVALLLRAVANVSEPVLKEEVVNLDFGGSASGFTVVETTPDTIMLEVASGTTLPFSVGDAVASAVGEGQLGRVESISVSGPRHTLHLTPLALADVVESGSISGTFVLEEDDRTQALRWKQVAASGDKSDKSVSISVDFSDIRLLDSPVANIGIDQGRLSMETTLRIECAFERGTLRYFLLELRGDSEIDTQWRIGVLEGYSGSASLSVPLVPLPPILFFIGFVPVIITNAVNLSAGIEADLPSVSFHPHMTTSGRFRIGAKYQNAAADFYGGFGGRWSSNFDDMPIASTWAYRGFVGFSLDSRLYHILGPSVGIQGYAEHGRRVQTNPPSCMDWKKKAVAAGASLALDVFGPFSAYDRSWDLRVFEEDTQPCGPPPTTPTPIPTSTPTPTPTPSPPPTSTPHPTPLPGGEEISITLPGGVPLVMVRIPAGSFVMGSPPDERGRLRSEGPQTNVTLTRGFYMGKYEVTQGQWLAVMGSWPDATYNPDRSSGQYGRSPNHPMYYVSWIDAQNFIAALNAHITATGQGLATMRLPTEAEWEYACRAGTTTRFYFGDSLGCFDICSDCAAGTLPGNRSDYMWYCGNNASSGQPGYGTKPVGGKLPNAFGLYDMHGNVWEWCQDWWTVPFPGGSVTDPTGPSSGSARVLRGGSWDYGARYCRSAIRDFDAPSRGTTYWGFRLASVR